MSSSPFTTTLDGSHGEGGGQLIRNAISYASILRKEVRIINIRANRSKPGLQAQHVAGLQLAAAVSGGSLTGDMIHSNQVQYRPTKLVLIPNGTATRSSTPLRSIRGGVHTAGSICLMLQAAMPCALFSPTPCILYLKGGTNAIMAPQYDYWQALLLPTLFDHCGLAPDQVQATLSRRGFYPRGGGKVQVRIQPMDNAPLQPFRLTDRGRVRRISIRAFRTVGRPRSEPELMVQAASEYLRKHLHVCGEHDDDDDVEFHTDIVVESQATGDASGILIVALTSTGCRLAGSSLGPFHKSPEEIGTEAAFELVQNLQDGGCVDEWLQDQLILFAALADGISEILTGSLTLHTQTAIAVAEQMAGARFEITKLPVDKETESFASDLSIQDNALHQGTRTPIDTTNHSYGTVGRTHGRHLIRCYGIGFQRTGGGSASPTAPTTTVRPSGRYLQGLGGFTSGTSSDDVARSS